MCPFRFVCLCVVVYMIIYVCSYINVWVYALSRIYSGHCFRYAKCISFFICIYMFVCVYIYMCIQTFLTHTHIQTLSYICNKGIKQCIATNIYIYIYIYTYKVSKVGDRNQRWLGGSLFNWIECWSMVPGRVLPKTLKMVLDTSLLNTQQYKVRIKGKVE